MAGTKDWGKGIKSQNFPIWDVLDEQGRRLDWFARKTGYSYHHVVHVKMGVVAATPTFMERCAEVLQIPVASLFYLPTDSTVEVAHR